MGSDCLLVEPTQHGARKRNHEHAYMVDNQAIVIPETIDAIRALTGAVTDANESIARTNAALGIEAAFI